MSSKPHSWLRLLCAVVIGGFFIYSGAVKIADPAAFLLDIRSFDLLPDPYAAVVAMTLPWLECLAGLAVVSGVMRRGGLLLINGCLVMFLAAILISWARGLDIRCGCLGGDSSVASNYVELIVRDVILLAIGLVAQYGYRNSSPPPSA